VGSTVFPNPRVEPKRKHAAWHPRPITKKRKKKNNAVVLICELGKYDWVDTKMGGVKKQVTPTLRAEKKKRKKETATYRGSGDPVWVRMLGCKKQIGDENRQTHVDRKQQKGKYVQYLAKQL